MAANICGLLDIETPYIAYAKEDPNLMGLYVVYPDDPDIPDSIIILYGPGQRMGTLFHELAHHLAFVTAGGDFEEADHGPRFQKAKKRLQRVLDKVYPLKEGTWKI